MRNVTAGLGLFVGVAVAVLALCMPQASSAPTEGFPAVDAPAIVAKMGADKKLEMGFLKDGSFDEVEFHVDYAAIPQNIRDAFEKTLPGGKVIDSEIEYSKGALHYEVTKEIDGKESEVLVDANGQVVLWENEVEETKVPDAVRKAAATATGGTVTAWEEILDGAKTLKAFHVKKDENGIKWKIAISPAGAVEFVRREMVAEVEVTIR